MPLPLLLCSAPPLLSPEVSGVPSNCHQGKGVKIKVWFEFQESRTQLEEIQKVVKPRKPPLPAENTSPIRVTPLNDGCDVPNKAINPMIYK